MTNTQKSLILLGVFILAFMWSIWVFNNWPDRRNPPEINFVHKNIGYMDCMYSDGTGPSSKCGDMIIRCFTKRGGEQVECPTFENVYMKDK